MGGIERRPKGHWGDAPNRSLELFPKNQVLARSMKLAKERIQFPGLPARFCWLGYGERADLASQ